MRLLVLTLLAVRFLRNASLVSPSATVLDEGTSFRVAELKPHFACTSKDGQDRVRNYLRDLLEERYAIIALLQFEFRFPEPIGYSHFGDSCRAKHADSAVVLFDESVFSLVRVIGTGVAGNYTALPFLHSGIIPERGTACIGDLFLAGERAYAGAVLRHRSSAELCVISGTFPHHRSPPNPAPDRLLGRFVQEVRDGCGGLPILFVVDSNVWPDNQTLQDVGAREGADWGGCSDPGASAAKSCCNDIKKGYPWATLRFDRTAMCRGGLVRDFRVHPTFVCGTDEEHLFTSATVELP